MHACDTFFCEMSLDRIVDVLEALVDDTHFLLIFFVRKTYSQKLKKWSGLVFR